MAATDFKKQRLIVLSAAILYAMTTEVQSEHETPEANCKAIIEEIKDCWNLHPQLPSIACKNGINTSLVECAYEKLFSLQHCDFYKTWEGAHRSMIYTKAMDVLCHAHDIPLIEEFSKDQDCWRDARACAINVINIPKQTTYGLCQNITAAMSECKSNEQNPHRKGNCSEYIQLFVDLTFQNSEVCGVPALVAQLSLVLIAYLISFSSR